MQTCEEIVRKLAALTIEEEVKSGIASLMQLNFFIGRFSEVRKLAREWVAANPPNESPEFRAMKVMNEGMNNTLKPGPSESEG